MEAVMENGQSQTATLTYQPMKVSLPHLLSSTNPGVAVWATGCGLCSFGLLNPPSLRNGMSLYESVLAAFHAGALDFCECQAGQAKQRWLVNLAGRYKSDGQQIEQYRQDAEARKANRLFMNAGVPPKFLQYTWQSFKDVAGQDKGKELLITAIEKYFADECIQGESGPCWGIFAWGESDMGKTGALSQLFLHYLHNGRSGLWVQYNSLMRELRKFEDGNVDERINECKQVEYLFIDDFGDPLSKGEASNYSRDVMMQIIDHRNNYGKAMFITSNLSLDNLADQFHQRLAKRMMESCFVVRVAGKPLGVLSKNKK